MSVAELKKYTFIAKYANWLEDKKRRETWKEAVERNKNMMFKKYEHHTDVYPLIEEAYEAVFRKEVLGSQRALQFAGSPVFKHNARLFNCVAANIDRLRFFQECMYLLMCGCGTGFSVQTHHIAKLPRLRQELGETKVFVIEDSIEGWSDSVGVLISSYFQQSDLFPEYAGKRVEFDFSQIRPAGSRLSSCAGKAPGPVPLQNSLEKIRLLLDRCLEQGLEYIRPIHAYDMVMFTADAVISGGIRRSATLCMFSHDDEEMCKAKTGNWFNENPQRGRSNNSAVLVRSEITAEEFAEVMSNTRQFGEPGFIFVANREQLFNPCVSKDTVITTENGLRTVTDLIGNKFVSLVDGKHYYSSDKGFWKTANKELVEIEFSSGRILKATGNHQLLTIDGWKEVDDISFNDEVVINNHRDKISNVDSTMPTFARGYLLGSFLGDGNVSNKTAQVKWWGEKRYDYRADAMNLLEQASWRSKHHIDTEDTKSTYSCINSVKLLEFAKERGCLENGKHLSKDALSGDWDYLSGLVAGYFDADGTVCVNPLKGNAIRITSSQIDNLRNLQIVLNAFGIYSKIYKDRYPEGYRKMPDGNGSSKEYWCEATHELHLSGDNIPLFLEKIKIRNTDKLAAIKTIVENYKRAPNHTGFTDKIINKRILPAEDVYDCTIPEVSAFDANGVYTHNCVEISLYGYDENGNSGWQGCNLSTINCSKVKTKEDFLLACKFASIIGTLQAGFTSFEYLGEVSENIFKREALLGVSMTGIMENTDITLSPEIQREGAEEVKKWNKIVADMIGINPAARSTCVKPEGSASCLLGTSSGIHPHHAKRYIRRVQANKMETIYQHFHNVNPLACEESVWSTNGTDDVIAFCIEVEDGAKLKNQISAVELLETVKLTQQNWVESGKRKELCVKPELSHNVSNTITVKPNEWEAVESLIYSNRDYFCGISLLPLSGDKDYPQAPFTTVYLPHEIVSYYGDCALLASGLITEGLDLFDDNLWKASEAILGIVPAKGQAKKLYITRCKEFAEKYLFGDLRKLTYLLKDVYNWKLWIDLKREYKNVDYTECVELENNVKLEQELSCVGGACLI